MLSKRRLKPGGGVECERVRFEPPRGAETLPASADTTAGPLTFRADSPRQSAPRLRSRRLARYARRTVCATVDGAFAAAAPADDGTDAF